MNGVTELRERAATIALLRQSGLAWPEVVERIDEAGSALAVLRGDAPAEEPEGTLFPAPGTPLADEAALGEVEAEIAAWQADGMRLLTILDADYPANLRTIHDRPPLLFVRGELIPDDERSVAVVGTRTPTDDGVAAARRISADLVAQRFVVVSGLAEGIDTAAHRGALDAGGRTLAVIGTGLRRCYPASNAELQRRLAQGSAVVSQFWPDQPPTRRTFPMRNVVMSGLTLATVVVEATKTSGARMQARLALEHGRPVFLLSRLLCHEWARDCAERPGAYVVESSDEVAEQLERLHSADPFAVA